MKSLFFGGVHPEGRKELSACVPLAAMALPAQAAVLLRQHIGAPCKPLVSVGDTVCMGQKIGDGEGLCVPVHAPVSGVVVGIEDRPHPGGGTCPAILIECGFLTNPGEEALLRDEDYQRKLSAVIAAAWMTAP